MKRQSLAYTERRRLPSGLEGDFTNVCSFFGLQLEEIPKKVWPGSEWADPRAFAQRLTECFSGCNVFAWTFSRVDLEKLTTYTIEYIKDLQERSEGPHFVSYGKIRAGGVGSLSWWGDDRRARIRQERRERVPGWSIGYSSAAVTS